ncbi:MAG: hypothetical protein IT165_03750 [Bryobacterales bacterium]|nr:hypothetical protein [Bryobacterales bacterium]
MPHTVIYERVEKYRQTGSGIVVPIALRAANATIGSTRDARPCWRQ